MNCMNKLLLSFIMLLSICFSACSKTNDIEPLIDNEQNVGNEDDNKNNNDEDSNDENEDANDKDNDEEPPFKGNNRYLVVYASRSGNTENMAQVIQSILDCDILRVEPTIPYENDYNAMLSRAQREQQDIEQGNYPSIKTMVDNFDSYDMIFIGYPIWHGHSIRTTSGLM